MIAASSDAVLFVVVPVLMVIWLVGMAVSIVVETYRRRHRRMRSRWQ